MVVIHERRDENAARTPYSLPAHSLLSAYVCTRSASGSRRPHHDQRCNFQFADNPPSRSCLVCPRDGTTLRPTPRVLHCDTPGPSAPFTVTQQHSLAQCVGGRDHSACAWRAPAAPARAGGTLPWPCSPSHLPCCVTLSLYFLSSVPLPSASRRNRRHPPSYYLVLVGGAAARRAPIPTRRSPRADPGCAPAGVQRRECGGGVINGGLIAFHARW